MPDTPETPAAGDAGATPKVRRARRTSAAEPEAIQSIADAFPGVAPKPKTYLEWWGTWLMLILLVIICAVCLVTLGLWWWTRPTQADLVAVLTASAGGTTQPTVPPDQRIDLLGKLQRSHTEQCVAVFQLVVLSVLVPLFTLVAGYVFGRNKSEEGR